MSFRIKKLPKDEKDMQEIVREIQEREAVEESHEHEEAHHHHHEAHEHYHEMPTGISPELIDAIAHLMEHQLSELAQISERSSRISRSLDDLMQSVDEVKELLRALIKLQLAALTDNREIKKKIIESVTQVL
ncbi:MAG: hypothetical protein ABWJ42_03500 [Sulfolobales archaeon]